MERSCPAATFEGLATSPHIRASMPTWPTLSICSPSRVQLAGLFATATFEGHIGISSLGACTAAAGDAADGFSIGQGEQLLSCFAIAQGAQLLRCLSIGQGEQLRMPAVQCTGASCAAAGDVKCQLPAGRAASCFTGHSLG